MKLLISITLLFCLVVPLAAQDEPLVVAANQDHMGYREVAAGATVICLAEILDVHTQKTEGRMLPSGEGSEVWLKVSLQKILRGTLDNSELAVLASNQKWYASGRFLKGIKVILFLNPCDATARPVNWATDLPAYKINGAWGKVLLRGFDEAEVQAELQAVEDALRSL